MTDLTAASAQRAILSAIPGVTGVHDPRPFRSSSRDGAVVDAAISTDRAANTPEVARAAADAILAAHPNVRRVRLEVRRISPESAPVPRESASVPRESAPVPRE